MSNTGDRFLPRSLLALGPVALGLALGLSPTNARAAEEDGSFGRIEGDVTFVGGVGGGVDASSKRALGHVEVRARYLQAAGIFLAYEEADAFAKTDDRGALRRAFLGGVEFRPLFPIRFLRHAEQGRAFGNLVLDSFAIDFGPIVSVREGSSTTRPGLFAGLGVELPLANEESGLWIRLATTMRWSPERLDGDAGDPGGRAVVFLLGLAWHQVAATHLVDAGDERPR
jgi:hypothetical protein